jgi:hypothetical protein
MIGVEEFILFSEVLPQIIRFVAISRYAKSIEQSFEMMCAALDRVM